MDGKKSDGEAPLHAGVISLAEIYTIEETKRRLGWSDSALRAAKRRGLRLLRSGKRRYVTGREILRFLRQETESCHRLQGPEPERLVNGGPPARHA